MVRFSSRNTVEQLLTKYYTMPKQITLSDISDETIEFRVYLNEHLTSSTFKIQRECLKLKKQKVLSKVIIKKGHVYISKEANRKPTRIDTMEEVQQINSQPSASRHGAGCSNPMDVSLLQHSRNITSNASVDSELSTAIDQMF